MSESNRNLITRSEAEGIFWDLMENSLSRMKAIERLDERQVMRRDNPQCGGESWTFDLDSSLRNRQITAQSGAEMIDRLKHAVPELGAENIMLITSHRKGHMEGVGAIWGKCEQKERII